MKKENENLVYDSDRLRVYEREQKLFDGTTKKFVRGEASDAAYILPIRDGKVLLCYENQPHREEWYRSHIGGVIEPDEDPELGAQRELLEETGFAATNFRLFWDKTLGGLVTKKRYVFVAKNLIESAKPVLDPGEKITLEWVSMDKYFEMIIDGTISGSSGRREKVMLDKIKGKLSHLEELFEEL